MSSKHRGFRSSFIQTFAPCSSSNRTSTRSGVDCKAPSERGSDYVFSGISLPVRCRFFQLFHPDLRSPHVGRPTYLEYSPLQVCLSLHNNHPLNLFLLSLSQSNFTRAARIQQKDTPQAENTHACKSQLTHISSPSKRLSPEICPQHPPRTLIPQRPPNASSPQPLPTSPSPPSPPLSNGLPIPTTIHKTHPHTRIPTSKHDLSKPPHTARHTRLSPFSTPFQSKWPLVGENLGRGEEEGGEKTARMSRLRSRMIGFCGRTCWLAWEG